VRARKLESRARRGEEIEKCPKKGTNKGHQKQAQPVKGMAQRGTLGKPVKREQFNCGTAEDEKRGKV